MSHVRIRQKRTTYSWKSQTLMTELLTLTAVRYRAKVCLSPLRNLALILTAGAMKELYMSVITHPCRLRGDFLSCCHLCAPFPECQYMRISCAPEKTRRPPSRAFARTLFEFNSIWPHLSGPVLQILIKKQYQWRSCTSEAPFYL
jgi:hypothetical protein